MEALLVARALTKLYGLVIGVNDVTPFLIGHENEDVGLHGRSLYLLGCGTLIT